MQVEPRSDIASYLLMIDRLPERLLLPSECVFVPSFDQKFADFYCFRETLLEKKHLLLENLV